MVDVVASVWRPWRTAIWPQNISIGAQVRAALALGAGGMNKLDVVLYNFSGIIRERMREILKVSPAQSPAGIGCQRHNHYNL